MKKIGKIGKIENSKNLTRLKIRKSGKIEKGRFFNDFFKVKFEFLLKNFGQIEM